MNIRLIILLIALLVGSVLGSFIIKDPGYLLVSYRSYVLETSLWLGIFVLISGSFLTLLFVALLKNFIKMPFSQYSWFIDKQHKNIRKANFVGLQQLLGGEYKKAAKSLVQGSSESDLPLLNYLAASRAMHAIKDYKGRDNLLQKAIEESSENNPEVRLLTAEFLISAQKLEPAQEILLQLMHKNPTNQLVQNLLVEISEVQNNWQVLQEFSHIEKHLTPNNHEKFLLFKLGSIINDKDKTPAQKEKQLNKIWNNIPKSVPKSTSLKCVYLDVLLDLEQYNKAFENIDIWLKEDWDDTLVERLGRSYGTKQLESAYNWSKQKPNNQALFMVIAKQELHLGNMITVKENLDKANSFGPTHKILSELGRFEVEQGNHKQGVEYFATALRLIQKQLVGKETATQHFQGLRSTPAVPATPPPKG